MSQTYTTIARVIDARNVDTKNGRRAILTVETNEGSVFEPWAGPEEVAEAAKTMTVRIRVSMTQPTTIEDAAGNKIRKPAEERANILPADPKAALARTMASFA